MTPPISIQLDPLEAIRLSAASPEFYCRTFFPGTVGQKTPPFHKDMWSVLMDRDQRLVGFEVFRGGAKTTTLRLFTSLRMALGISHTVLFVSASQDHSIRSLLWLRNQIEGNPQWANTFCLRKGSKWTDSHFEVINDMAGITINVLAVGITGQVRGININDHRPDLIVVDDPCDEENTATAEAREKMEALFFGALQKSLVPPTESPDAKMVFLQTSLHREDLINKCHEDSAWATRKFSCFDEKGQSTWPSRFTTEFLIKDKRSHVDRNILHIWLREMECTIVSAETADFRPEWLKVWIHLPERMVTYLGLDPVPPPSEREISLGLKTKDYECLAVVGIRGGEIYLCDYSHSRGHDPEWTISEFFRLLDKWRFLKAAVEGIAYQKTLKWLLEKAMKERKRYVQLDAVTDKRRKRHRIVQALSGPASQGQLYIHQSHSHFKEQFISYPGCKNDDILDAVAMAVDAAAGQLIESTLSQAGDIYEPIPASWRSAP